jgi:hypothetical protein
MILRVTERLGNKIKVPFLSVLPVSGRTQLYLKTSLHLTNAPYTLFKAELNLSANEDSLLR